MFENSLRDTNWIFLKSSLQQNHITQQRKNGAYLIKEHSIKILFASLFNVLVVVTKRCGLTPCMYNTIKVKNLMDSISKSCTETLHNNNRSRIWKNPFRVCDWTHGRWIFYGVSPPIVNPDIVILVCDLVLVSMATVILISLITKNSWSNAVVVLLKSIFTHWA